MLGYTRLLAYCALVGFLFGAAAEARAQVPADDHPAPYVPLKPPTRRDIERRDSLKQYVLGLLLEHADRPLEALKAFEEAARLDPEAPAVFKAQLPILISMGREIDALAVLNKALELDPGDQEAWFIAARLHKSLGHQGEARHALKRGLEAAGSDGRPEVTQQMYFDLASLCESANDPAGAVAALAGAAKILDHPDTLLDHGAFDRDLILARAAETHERMGNLLFKQKKYDDALAALKKAQAVFPERAGRLNFTIAQVLQEQGKSKQALVAIDAYLRFQPLGLEAYELKCRLLEKLNKEDTIVPWLERASAADPNNTRLKVFLAKQYGKSRQYAKATELFQALAAKAPSSDIYRAWFHMLQDAPRQGLAQALRMLDSAIDEAAKTKGPPGPAAHQAKAMIGAVRDDAALAKGLVDVAFSNSLRTGGLQPDTVRLLAVLADKYHKLEAAEDFYRRSLRSAGVQGEALVYGGLLRVLWKEHKYEAVLQVCTDGLKRARGTNPVLFHMEKAKALARLERLDAALLAADQAIGLAGDNDKLVIRHLRVRILVQAEKYDQAEAACQTLLKEYTAPGDVIEIRYLLSLVYSARRDLAKAEHQLEIILKADPNNATVNNDLGYTWADQNKNLDKAEVLIRRALELDRRQRELSPSASADARHENAAYIDSLGWVLFRRGRLDEARVQLELATRLPEGSDDPTVWDHLGDVYFRLLRTTDARSAWEKSAHLFETEKTRKMDERYREVRRKLQALDSAHK